MKKLLLLFAVMLTTVGAWAQVNYGKRTWTFPATSHEAVAEVPAEIFTDFAAQYSETELTNEKVGVFVTDVRVATEGDVTATFVYNGGNIRMDIGGVDLVNANGEVVYSDYHFGYSGGNKVDNVYTLTGVAVGDYTMRAFIPAQKEDITPATTNDSKGVLTITGAWMYLTRVCTTTLRMFVQTNMLHSRVKARSLLRRAQTTVPVHIGILLRLLWMM